MNILLENKNSDDQIIYFNVNKIELRNQLFYINNVEYHRQDWKILSVDDEDIIDTLSEYEDE